MSKEKMNENLTIKERLVVRLVMFLIKMIEPYEYEHQFKELYEDISTISNEKINNR